MPAAEPPLPALAEPELADVVVVGAGPGGSAAAIALLRAEPGLQVVLADKAGFPRDKCCGDGLGPGVVSVLTELDLLDVVAGETPVEQCAVFGPGGTRFDGELPKIRGRSMRGYVVPRLVFDERLVRHAQAAGASLRERWRFEAMTAPSGGRRVITFATPDGPRRVAARLVVGADGAGSRVRAALGVSRNPDRLTGIAVRAYTRDAAPTDRRLVFEFSERLLPAYAWYFPATGDLVNIGLGLVVRDHKRRKPDLAALLDEFAVLLGERGHDLVATTSRRTYLLPHGARLPRLAHDRAVLVGDAGSMINPLSGEGIFYAMAAGALLGEVAGRRLRGDDGELAGALGDFERRFRRRFAAHFRSNYVASVFFRSRAWVALVVRAAARDPIVVRDGVELLFAEGRIRATTTARILWAGLRR